MDDYLKQLADLIQENHRKRNEETDSVTDDTPVPGMYKNFTKKIQSENPNIPQDDVKDYVNNVKDDSTNYLMGAGMSAAPMKVMNSLEQPLARFGKLMDNSMVDKVIGKIREPMLADKNIGLMNRAATEGEMLAKRNQVPEMELPKTDELTDQRNYRNWMNDKLANEKELGYMNNQSELQKAIPNQSIGADEATVPGVSQELIDAIIKRKSGGM